MCGIAGVFNLNNKGIDQDKLVSMTRIIKHRGPDDEGYLLVNANTGKTLECFGDDTPDSIKKATYPIPSGFEANLAFGFRRLSIIDVSEHGHQPMCNSDRNIWIVFNGEIYNYIEIRNELITLGYKFNSNSDTEVIIKAYEEWGEFCLNRFNGMWAFALWDNRKKLLFCARDRFGIKPFYYYFDGNTFIFASEVKQILEWNINKDLNEDVIYKSFSLGSFLINSNNTYFKAVQILPHAHYLTLKKNDLQITRFYDLDFESFEKNKMSFSDASQHYNDLFTDAVRLRMRSDVEVGSTLSGGLDSSAIVGVASKLTSKKFKTFTSYYPQHNDYDERRWVNYVVERTNSKPYFISQNIEGIINDFSTITWHHDYPLIGSSSLAQFYVMQLARKNGVIVLLDGQGSDELLGGYRHAFYRYYADLLRKFNLPRFIQEFPDYIKLKNSSVSKKLFNTGISFLFNEKTLYKNEARFAFNPIVAPEKKIEFPEIQNINSSKFSNFLYNQIMATSIQTLLHFEDRNSMANSIESRVPFLDYRLVEFIFSLPAEFKIRNNISKYIHRNALKSHVPPEILDRKDKLGFATPGEQHWLRNEMKSMFLEIINSNDFKSRGIFNVKEIKRESNLYFNGKNKHGQKLWMVMALEIWFKEFIDN